VKKVGGEGGIGGLDQKNQRNRGGGRKDYLFYLDERKRCATKWKRKGGKQKGQIKGAEKGGEGNRKGLRNFVLEKTLRSSFNHWNNFQIYCKRSYSIVRGKVSKDKGGKTRGWQGKGRGEGGKRST